jgi:hypothetical protein
LGWTLHLHPHPRPRLLSTPTPTSTSSAATLHRHHANFDRFTICEHAHQNMARSGTQGTQGSKAQQHDTKELQPMDIGLSLPSMAIAGPAYSFSSLSMLSPVHVQIAEEDTQPYGLTRTHSITLPLRRSLSPARNTTQT